MKTICNRHLQAYEVGQSCPWCEPAAVVQAAKSLGIRDISTREDLYALFCEGEAIMQLTYQGSDLAKHGRVQPTWMPDLTRPEVLVRYKHKFPAGPKFTVDGVTLYDKQGYKIRDREFNVMNVPDTADLEITFDLTHD